jgi:hypothetical protein
VDRVGRVAVTLLGVVWCWAGRVEAAELVLNEPAACITADELSFRVERALGMPLGGAEAVQLSVHVQAEPSGFGAQLGVVRAGVRGERALHAPSCEELSESLVVAIVVAIGAEESPPPPPPAPPPPAAPPSTTAPPAAEEAPPPSAAPESGAGLGPSIVGSAWMIADTGTLPAPGIGAGVGVTLGWPRLQLRAVGTLLPEREGNLNASAGSPGASIGLLAGSAMGCVSLGSFPSWVALAACAGWELGQLSGSGTHVSTPYQQSALWSAARLDLASRWALTSVLSLELQLTAVAPFTRDAFILKDLGSVYRPASVLGRLGLGLGVAID